MSHQYCLLTKSPSGRASSQRKKQIYSSEATKESSGLPLSRNSSQKYSQGSWVINDSQSYCSDLNSLDNGNNLAFDGVSSDLKRFDFDQLGDADSLPDTRSISFMISEFGEEFENDDYNIPEGVLEGGNGEGGAYDNRGLDNSKNFVVILNAQQEMDRMIFEEEEELEDAVLVDLIEEQEGEEAVLVDLIEEQEGEEAKKKLKNAEFQQQFSRKMMPYLKKSINEKSTLKMKRVVRKKQQKNQLDGESERLTRTSYKILPDRAFKHPKISFLFVSLFDTNQIIERQKRLEEISFYDSQVLKVTNFPEKPALRKKNLKRKRFNFRQLPEVEIKDKERGVYGRGWETYKWEGANHHRVLKHMIREGFLDYKNKPGEILLGRDGRIKNFFDNRADKIIEVLIKENQTQKVSRKKLELQSGIAKISGHKSHGELAGKMVFVLYQKEYERVEDEKGAQRAPEPLLRLEKTKSKHSASSEGATTHFSIKVPTKPQAQVEGLIGENFNLQNLKHNSVKIDQRMVSTVNQSQSTSFNEEESDKDSLSNLDIQYPSGLTTKKFKKCRKKQKIKNSSNSIIQKASIESKLKPLEFNDNHLPRESCNTSDCLDIHLSKRSKITSENDSFMLGDNFDGFPKSLSRLKSHHLNLACQNFDFQNLGKF